MVVTRTFPGPNSAHTMDSYDRMKIDGKVIITKPGALTVDVVVKLKVTGVEVTFPETPVMEKKVTQQVQGTVILKPMVSVEVSTEMYGSAVLVLHPMLKP